ncbi:hypothetical protein [Nocardia sp. SC052]|uniref:hypothetical protein n=1 Tax=Nocardia sichangensis TaxID=3385975 RepID=UPI0039A21E49
MSQSLHIDAEQVHALITELADIAQSSQRDLAELKEALDREGEPWGHDEPGRMVGDAYLPQLRKGLGAYRNLVDNIRELGEGIADIADAFRDEDRDGARRIRSARQSPFDTDRIAPVGTRLGMPTWPSNTSDTQDRNLDPAVGRTGAQSAQLDNGTDPAAPVPTSYLGATVPSPSDGQPAALFRDPSAGSGNDLPLPVTNAAAQPGSTTAHSDSAAAERYGATVPSALPNLVAQPTGAVAQQPADKARNGGRPAATGRSSTTPWSRSQSGIVLPQGQSGTPRERSLSPRPGQVIPPGPAGPARRPAKSAQPGRQIEDRKRKQPPPTAAPAPPTDVAALTAARALAARHRLRIEGFDCAGISEAAVRELAAAVDHILTTYPFLKLGGIEITDLGDKAVSRVTMGRANAESAESEPNPPPWILLDRHAARNGIVLAEKISTAQRLASVPPNFGNRPLYSVVVAEFGQIMVTVAGPGPLQQAQRFLITEYRRISGPWDGDETLARVVRGYRQWRAQLTGTSGPADAFHPRAALVSAFTEVEVLGEAACGPAKVLHRLLVDIARQGSATA